MPKMVSVGKLRVPQIRVLQVLYPDGALSKEEIRQRIGLKALTVVDQAIGSSDPNERKKESNEKGVVNYPSLLSMGYVEEDTIELDSPSGGTMTERSFSLTVKGKNAFEALGDVQLPKLNTR